MWRIGQAGAVQRDAHSLTHVCLPLFGDASAAPPCVQVVFTLTGLECYKLSTTDYNRHCSELFNFTFCPN
ncbi:unnamed protein product, partial [Brenthis ino]